MKSWKCPSLTIISIEELNKCIKSLANSYECIYASFASI